MLRSVEHARAAIFADAILLIEARQVIFLRCSVYATPPMARKFYATRRRPETEAARCAGVREATLDA